MARALSRQVGSGSLPRQAASPASPRCHASMAVAATGTPRSVPARAGHVTRPSVTRVNGHSSSVTAPSTASSPSPRRRAERRALNSTPRNSTMAKITSSVHCSGVTKRSRPDSSTARSSTTPAGARNTQAHTKNHGCALHHTNGSANGETRLTGGRRAGVSSSKRAPGVPADGGCQRGTSAVGSQRGTSRDGAGGCHRGTSSGSDGGCQRGTSSEGPGIESTLGLGGRAGQENRGSRAPTRAATRPPQSKASSNSENPDRSAWARCTGPASAAPAAARAAPTTNPGSGRTIAWP